MITTGVGANVILAKTAVTLEIRPPQGEDIDEFYGEMKRVIDDPAVKIVPIPSTRPEAPASRLDTEMYRTIEQVSQRMYPASVTLPAMSTGASDMAQLRARGIPSYGLGPAVTDEDRA